MQRRIVAIAGFGDLGERLAPRLDAAGWTCAGLRRRVERLPPGVQPLAADLARPASLRELTALRPEVLVFMPTPDAPGEAGYRAGFARAAANLVEAVASCPPQRAILVSSTRVYAESAGGWVDEEAPLADDDACARAIIDAERAFLDAFAEPLVLRAGGLYGRGPGHLLRRVAAGQLTAPEPPRYSNRIHRDDMASCLAHAVDGGFGTARVVNAVDDVAAPLQDVERWLCEQLGRAYEPPAAATPGGGHKRVNNARLRAAGVHLDYPDYRAGYGEVLRRWLAHSEREDSLDLH